MGMIWDQHNLAMVDLSVRNLEQVMESILSQHIRGGLAATGVAIIRVRLAQQIAT